MQAQGSELTGLVGWIADVLAALGPAGVGLLTFLETFFPPIPSEVVLPLSGFLVSRGRFSLAGALVGSTAGSLLAAGALYWVGARLGERRLEGALRRVPLVEPGDVDRARSWFERHGRSAVLIGRFVPGVRSVVSLPAGTARMPVATFLAATAVGSALWNAALIGAGWLLGDRWRNVGRYSDLLNYALIAALVVIVARFLWRRRGRIHAPWSHVSARPNTDTPRREPPDPLTEEET